ncbi:Putative metallopeptidase, catalytic domain superfamily [Colletotrichum destructivum]|uniref:Metallopeptidase, catalytic domain superfamily n=1 Tax=Colletotrichum destructivum TaxID=34406 RepID=A0AAX4I853_9PEZI|nr:Putative metallopeptidase, catalytic domain superfamily [Colletotrichum destructivum]
MSLTTWMTSFLILSTLNFGHIFAAPSSAEHDLLSRNAKRELKSWVAVGSEGPWPCSDSQLEKIKGAVDDAKALANAAISALNDHGASREPTNVGLVVSCPDLDFPSLPVSGFERVLIECCSSQSDSVAHGLTPETIKKKHYQTVLAELRPPTSATLKHPEQDGPDPKRLVFGCPKAKSSLCRNNPRSAGAIDADKPPVNAGKSAVDGDIGAAKDVKPFTVNIIILCPAFFEEVSQSEMISNWKKKERDYTPSAGLVLLHETQHISAIVGADSVLEDIGYSIRECRIIKDEYQIKNARNYAFFALDVAANPPQSKAPKL